MKKLIILSLSICLLFFSCKKFLTIPPPETELVKTTIFDGNATAIAAQSAVYAQIANSFSNDLMIELGYSADEWINYSTDENDLQLFTNTLNSSNISVYNIWSGFYSDIYQANNVLEGIKKGGINVKVKQQLEGEAKFTRAFCYFYLVNLFGDIPLILSSNYKQNILSVRNSSIQINNQIKKDLLDARNTLSQNYLALNLMDISQERVRPNKATADALLARIYLYNKQYDSAFLFSNEIINNPIYQLKPLTDVFLRNSTETIWALDCPYNTSQAFLTLIAVPFPYKISLSQSTILAFESGDQREQFWTQSYDVDGVSYVYPYKYKNTDFSGTVTELDVVFRLAEQYLIRAEAQTNGAGGGMDAGIKDLNKIRNRAGLINYDGLLNKDSILAAIFHERQVELFSEWGHRWLDLKRTGSLDKIMKIVTPEKGGNEWDPDQQFYPIPQREREKDPNLTQNRGYN